MKDFINYTKKKQSWNRQCSSRFTVRNFNRLHAASVGAPYVMNAFMGIINLKPPILASGGSLNPNVIEGLIFLLKLY